MLASSRVALRSARAPRSLQSRFASSSSEQSGKQALEKGQQALHDATQKSAELLKSAQETLGNALGAYKEPIFGNVAVAREVLKQVYVVEKLAPPTLAQVTATYSTVFSNLKNVSYLKNVVESGEWKRYAIYAAEAYGIFCIGEMISRGNVVGYNLKDNTPAPAHE